MSLIHDDESDLISIGRRYWFKVLPLGLNIALGISTKMMTPILREVYLHAVAYLDDWLFWAVLGGNFAEEIPKFE